MRRQVVVYQLNGGLVMANGEEPVQECLVSKRDPARTVGHDHILVMLAHLNNTARSVPLVGMRISLVLHAHKVPHCMGWEASGVLSPNVSRADVALGHPSLPSVSRATLCGASISQGESG